MQNINAQAQFNACAAGDAAAVSRLLPAGGPPRNLSGPRFQQGDIKSTALIAAAAFGHTEIVQMILAPNTDVNYANAMGDTALIMAAQYHHADILRLLADRGASLIFTGQRRFTHRGGDSRIEGPGGFTPLHLAVAPIRPGEPRRNPDPDGARQIASVRALLRLSAVRDSVDVEGFTPLCIACNLGLTKVAVALMDAGAKINFATPPPSLLPGFTPLMYAAIGNRAGLAKMLHKRGADGTKTITHAFQWHEPALEHGEGSTALDIARRCAARDPDCAETFAALRKRCCSTCGMTSPGLGAARTRLKQCSGCPAGGPSAHYCNEQCQRADWVPWHRSECAEARRAQRAAELRSELGTT